MKLRLIEGWQQAYKFLSVQIAALLVLLDVAYTSLPAIQAYFPEGWVKWFALAIIVGMAQALGLTDEQVDALFEQGVAL